MLNNIIQPIHSIATNLQGLGDIKSYCPDPGGACDGDCVPFCCFNGGGIPVFVDQGKGADYTMALAEAGFGVVASVVMAASVPGAGIILVAVYELLKPLANWLNTTINKKRMEAEQLVIQESSIKSIAYNLQAALECRLPWCEVIVEMQKWPVFAAPSITFGWDGPTVGKQSIGAYIALADIMHKDRLDKTNQKIITCAASTPGYWKDKQEYYQMYDGKLMIRVPNIEHFWMHDNVIINGDTSKIYKVVHRYGTSNKITWDCDNHFVDHRIIPDMLLTVKGRGCKISLSSSYIGSAQSGGGFKSGYNIRSIGGEGWLVTDQKYIKSQADTFIGGQVDLYRKIYTIPTTNPAGDDKPPSLFSKLIPLNNALVASFFGNKNMVMQGVLIALLAGTGVYLLNEGLKKRT